MLKYSLLLSLVLAVSACSSGDPDPFEGDVDLKAEATSLSLTNHSNRAVHYATVEVQGIRDGGLDADAISVAALLDQSPLIRPGETATVPYSDVLFFDEGDQEIFVKWQTEEANIGAERIVSVPGADAR